MLNSIYLLNILQIIFFKKMNKHSLWPKLLSYHVRDIRIAPENEVVNIKKQHEGQRGCLFYIWSHFQSWQTQRRLSFLCALLEKMQRKSPQLTRRMMHRVVTSSIITGEGLQIPTSIWMSLSHRCWLEQRDKNPGLLQDHLIWDFISIILAPTS